MAKAGARDKITLACEVCKQRNYNSMKNKKNVKNTYICDNQVIAAQFLWGGGQ